MSDIRFKIDGEELPLPDTTKASFADTIAVYQVTGLSWEDFEQCASVDVRVAGLIAIALQRRHPDWNAAKIGELVRHRDISNLDVLGVEVAEPTVPPPSSSDESSEPSVPSDNASGSEGQPV